MFHESITSVLRYFLCGRDFLQSREIYGRGGGMFPGGFLVLVLTCFLCAHLDAMPQGGQRAKANLIGRTELLRVLRFHMSDSN